MQSGVVRYQSIRPRQLPISLSHNLRSRYEGLRPWKVRGLLFLYDLVKQLLEVRYRTLLLCVDFRTHFQQSCEYMLVAR